MSADGNGKLPHASKLNPCDIWTLAQNRPVQIARDLAEYGVAEDVVLAVLLARGAFKWFAVRRELVRLKNAWRARVNELLDSIIGDKVLCSDGNCRTKLFRYRLAYVRGKLAAYEEVHREVRTLLHSQRFRAPNNDRHAQLFVHKLRQEWKKVKEKVE